VPSSSMSSQAGQFGPNEWLVEEMYQRFLDDPTAVDPAWHDFFADYRPEDGDASPAAIIRAPWSTTVWFARRIPAATSTTVRIGLWLDLVWGCLSHIGRFSRIGHVLCVFPRL